MFREAENREIRPAPVDEIGARVRDHRRSRGWSMRELAARAGVSQPFVSKLEGAQLLPSLPTLYALAEALDIPPSELLPSVDGRGEGNPASELHLPLGNAPGSVAARLIAGGAGALIQAYEFTLRAGEGDESYFRHGGEEFVYVVRGTITCEREGLADTAVGPGSSLRIDPPIPHRWTAADEDATFLLVCAEDHWPSRVGGNSPALAER